MPDTSSRTVDRATNHDLRARCRRISDKLRTVPYADLLLIEGMGCWCSLVSPDTGMPEWVAVKAFFSYRYTVTHSIALDGIRREARRLRA